MLLVGYVLLLKSENPFASAENSGNTGDFGGSTARQIAFPCTSPGTGHPRRCASPAEQQSNSNELTWAVMGAIGVVFWRVKPMEAPQQKWFSRKAQRILAEFDTITDTQDFIAEGGTLEREIRSFLVSVASLLKGDCKIRNWKHDFSTDDTTTFTSDYTRHPGNCLSLTLSHSLLVGVIHLRPTPKTWRSSFSSRGIGHMLRA